MSWSTPSLNDDRCCHVGFSLESIARRRTILLVEDDLHLLPLKREILQGAGYKVHGFDAADDALQFFLSDQAVDLLLSDVGLGPGLSGIELAERIAKVKPGLPVLLMSGSTLSELQLWKIRAKRWTFVRKPLRVARLLSIIEFLLQPGPPPVSSDERQLPHGNHDGTRPAAI